MDKFQELLVELDKIFCASHCKNRGTMALMSLLGLRLYSLLMSRNCSSKWAARAAAAIVAAVLGASPGPVVAQSPSRLAEVKIIAIVPQVIEPGDDVRINFSKAILGSSSEAESLSVLIGGRLAQPVRAAGADVIIAKTPANLPRGRTVAVSVIGFGGRLDAPTDLMLTVDDSKIVEARKTEPEVDWMNLALWSAIIFLFLFFFAAAITVGYWTSRRKQAQATEALLRRNAELTNDLQLLRFRLEREPAEATTAGEESRIEASAAPAERIIILPAIPDDLIDRINRGECVLFWGGGLSAQAGYPTWREALGEIIEQTQEDNSQRADLDQSLKAGRYSLVADALAQLLPRDKMIAQVARLWGVRRPLPPAILQLGNLPFSNAVTSVWDPLIEQAFATRQSNIVMGVSSDSLERLLTREEFSIVRLWGALSQPDSLLFTSSEYRTAVASNPTYAKYLASLTLSQSHLFVGAGLDTIEEYLSTAPRGSSSRPHYALVPETEGIELARGVFKQRGVELLVFRPTPGWPEVQEFLKNLTKAVEARPRIARRAEIEPILLKQVELLNIGPFQSLSLDLDANWNVLLGNNGTGKSSVLRAIALVLCGDDSRAVVEGARLLRAGARDGFVQVTVGSDIYRTDLVRDSNGNVHVNVGTRVAPLKSGKWVILAFPPLRGISHDNPNGPTAAEDSPFPVLSDVLPILVGQTDDRLASLKQWLINLDVRSNPGDGVTPADADRNRKLRDHFFDVFNAFHPRSQVKFAGVDRKTWQVSVTSNGAKISIDQVSQGTSSILGWVGALLQRMYEIHGSDKDMKQQSAVVLIDEIDAHLHPEWQQEIVGTLSDRFHAVQFIATSHSALIVGELEQSQVYRMVRQSNGEVTASHPAYPIKGLGVAGLLTSDLFGLKSVIDSETRELLEQQRAMTVADELNEDDKRRLQDVNKMLEGRGFGHQMRDPEYTRYLKERDELIKERSGPSPSDTPPQGDPPAAIKELIRTAISRAAQGRDPNAAA